MEKSSRSRSWATVSVRVRRTTSANESFDEPLPVEPDLGARGIEDLHRLIDVELRVRVDLRVREDRPLRGAPGRVTDPGRVVADDQDARVARVLERAHPLQRDPSADVDVGRRDVDPELDAERSPELQLGFEAAGRQQLDVVPGKEGDVAHRR